MKQNTAKISSDSPSLFDYGGGGSGDDDEMQVAEILLQLSKQALESGFPFTWGCKRRRSAIDLTQSSPPPRKRVEEKAVAATSPATPLSFSPSESDDKSKTSSSKIISKKMNKEELIHDLSKLTETRELLKGEVEEVRRYYDKLKALNLELKARKQENQFQPLMTDLRVDQTMRMSTSRFEEYQLLHHHPFGSNQMPGMASSSNSVNYMMGPSAGGGGGGGGIPDLNLSLDEAHDVDSSQPLDLMVGHGGGFNATFFNKAMAAQARKKRMQIYKVKCSVTSSKPRHHAHR